MPIRRSSLSSNIDGFNSSIDTQKRLYDEAIKSKDAIKSIQISKLHNIKTEVTYYEQIISDRQGNLANITSFNKFDTNLQTYKKIENLVILTDELSAQMDGEQSLTLIEEGTAKLLPNTLIPNINDYFIMKVFDRYSVFRITEITPSPIESNSGYEINFVLYEDDIIPDNFVIEGGQILDEYTFDYNHVGTEFRTIIRKSEYETIHKAKIIMEELSEIHSKAFYNPTLNTLFLTDNQIPDDMSEYLNYKFGNGTNTASIDAYVGRERKISIYDNQLVRFMNKFNLLSPNKYIHTLTEYRNEYDRSYRETIFRAVETRDSHRLIRFNQSVEYFSIIKYGYYSNKLYNKFVIEHTTDPVNTELGILHLFPQNFITTLTSTYNRDQYTSNIRLVYNSAIDLFTHLIKVFIYEEDDNHRLSIISEFFNIIMDEFFDYLYEDEFDNISDTYYIYPIIIYIGKYIVRELSSMEF